MQELTVTISDLLPGDVWIRSTHVYIHMTGSLVLCAPDIVNDGRNNLAWLTYFTPTQQIYTQYMFADHDVVVHRYITP